MRITVHYHTDDVIDVAPSVINRLIRTDDLDDFLSEIGAAKPPLMDRDSTEYNARRTEFISVQFTDPDTGHQYRYSQED